MDARWPGRVVELGLMVDRSTTTVDPEALADAIVADQPAAQARSTGATRRHLDRLGPELAKRLETGSGCDESAGSTT